MTDAPPFTILSWVTRPNGGVLVLVRAAGGRRVKVYVRPDRVTDIGLGEAVDAALAMLPRPPGPHT